MKKWTKYKTDTTIVCIDEKPLTAELWLEWNCLLSLVVGVGGTWNLVARRHLTQQWGNYQCLSWGEAAGCLAWLLTTSGVEYAKLSAHISKVQKFSLRFLPYPPLSHCTEWHWEDLSQQVWDSIWVTELDLQFCTINSLNMKYTKITLTRQSSGRHSEKSQIYNIF